MVTRFAFMGFRHGHIYALYELVKQREDTELVASCEEDEATRQAHADGKAARITHDCYARILQEVECDVVAVGDYYGKRGRVLVEALRAGKHVIADKPLCTRLSELQDIEALAKEKNLAVGLMLDLRSLGRFLKVRELIRGGEIGEVHAIAFGGQHPLLYGNRASWYFEEGKHGGTLNDIGIHAVDLIPWVTGIQFATINAARNWNAMIRQEPHFKDGAQMMLTMENGCGVLGDVSYFSPDSMGWSLPMYWRFTFWGTKGVLETSETIQGILLCRNGEKEPLCIPVGSSRPGGYLKDLLLQITGRHEEADLTTADVIHSSRVALKIQEAADRGMTNVSL